MNKTLLLWFLLLLTILTYSVCASKSTAEYDDSRISKSPIQPKCMYGEIMGSRETSNQMRLPKVKNVQHGRRILRVGKPVNGGGSSDMLRRPNGRRSSSSLSSQPSTLFMAALKHLLLGLLFIACFY